jgi:hypothetical protein
MDFPFYLPLVVCSQGQALGNGQITSVETVVSFPQPVKGEDLLKTNRESAGNSDSS